MRRNQNFGREIRLFDFWIFFSLSFFPWFFFFLLLWLAFSRACLGLKKVSGRFIEVANFYHGAARCSGRKFGSGFFAQLFEHFLCIFQVPISRSLWTRHHWKDLFLPQKLSIDDAKFGQKWWCQKWKKGQGSSRAVTGGTGINGLTENHEELSQHLDGVLG